MVGREIRKGIVKTVKSQRLNQKFETGDCKRHLAASEFEDGHSGTGLTEFQYAVASRKRRRAAGGGGEQQLACVTGCQRVCGYQQLIEPHIPDCSGRHDMHRPEQKRAIAATGNRRDELSDGVRLVGGCTIAGGGLANRPKAVQKIFRWRCQGELCPASQYFGWIYHCGRLVWSEPQGTKPLDRKCERSGTAVSVNQWQDICLTR